MKFIDCDGNIKKCIENAHDDIIRDIKEEFGVIFTTSNDETIKVWSIDGEL